jgi:hypothetical protein
MSFAPKMDIDISLMRMDPLVEREMASERFTADRNRSKKGRYAGRMEGLSLVAAFPPVRAVAQCASLGITAARQIDSLGHGRTVAAGVVAVAAVLGYAFVPRITAVATNALSAVGYTFTSVQALVDGRYRDAAMDCWHAGRHGLTAVALLTASPQLMAIALIAQAVFSAHRSFGHYQQGNRAAAVLAAVNGLVSAASAAPTIAIYASIPLTDG